MNVELLQKARDFLATLPESKISLISWMDYDEDCGTIGCAAGWLAKEGIIPNLRLVCTSDGDYIPWAEYDTPTSWTLYGNIIEHLASVFSCSFDEAHNLFSSVGESELDFTLFPEYEDQQDLEYRLPVSHQELALRRFDYYIKEYTK